MEITKKKKLKNWKQEVFYYAMLLWPVVQIAVFYFGVNINTVFLSFKQYDVLSGKYVWDGVTNFSRLFQELNEGGVFTAMISNSLIGWAITTFVPLLFTIPMSVYLYKNMPGTKFFRYMSVLPGLVPGMCTSLIFGVVADRVIPSIWLKLTGEMIDGLLISKDTAFTAILINMLLNGMFGSLIYISCFCSVDMSIIEAGRLDGMGPIREFIYILLPSIYPMLTISLSMSIVSIFTANYGLFDLFSTWADPELYTFGYYIFLNTYSALPANYPYVATMGLCMTLITFPCVLLVKKLLKKVGPSDE